MVRDALTFDAHQRAVVANTLLESIHGVGEVSEVDDAWRTEVTKRLTEMRSGAVELVGADEHFTRLRAYFTA